MIRHIRKVNFGYFLVSAGLVVLLVGYQKLFGTPPENVIETENPTFAKLKNIGILLAGVYIIVAGALKIYRARPRKGRR